MKDGGTYLLDQVVDDDGTPVLMLRGYRWGIAATDANVAELGRSYARLTPRGEQELRQVNRRRRRR